LWGVGWGFWRMGRQYCRHSEKERCQSLWSLIYRWRERRPDDKRSSLCLWSWFRMVDREWLYVVGQIWFVFRWLPREWRIGSIGCDQADSGIVFANHPSKSSRRWMSSFKTRHR
jgi:hypothetical protein